MSLVKTIACIFSTLILIFFCSFDVSAQKWKKKKPETLYARNKGKNFSPIYVGIGTSQPTAQLHTVGTVRLQSLNNNLLAPRILCTDIDGNLFWRDISSISGNIGWLLSGNSITTSQFLGTINNDDLRFRSCHLKKTGCYFDQGLLF